MSAVKKTTDIERLGRLEPISSLPADQIRELLEGARLEYLEPGQTLFAAGDDDGQAVYLLEGSVELRPHGSGATHPVSAGSDEARHPIADEYPRRATAVAVTRAEIARIDKELLDTLLTWGQISAPEEDVVMSEDGIITINKADWLRTMIKSPTFRRLPPSNVEQLLHQLEPVIVHAGEVIIRQGDAGDYFYMIDQGIALVMRNPDNDEDSIEMAELDSGASFGEAALISDNPRNATVSMMSDGILLRLSKEDFNTLLRQPTLEAVDYIRAAAEVAAGAAAWIDVRLPSEFAHSHLPRAHNIPMRALHKEARGLDRSISYICYCQTGSRSSAAVFVLKNYGIEARVLRNGLQGVPPEALRPE
ncbi:MAG: cyclic nucleotide-binding domain-containing protein [Gammaproteobacteria bacterium]|nr:cyclic nucleotide-binding domain-containing protein [Gammaproteobacteria bacterium]